jgi:hypothetical protein
LQIHYQFREHIHPLNKPAYITGLALFDIEVVAYLPGGGDEVFAVFPG